MFTTETQRSQSRAEGRKRAFVLLSAGCLSLILACGPKRLDLAPASAEGSAGGAQAYCDRDQEGRLAIHIRNLGEKAIQATTTVVEFESLPPVVLPTRPIEPGQEVSVNLLLPDACRDSCRFTVLADARQEIAEIDEANNQVTGSCP